MSAWLTFSLTFTASLDPLVKNGFWIGAEISEVLIDKIETCVVRFSLRRGGYHCQEQDGIGHGNNFQAT